MLAFLQNVEDFLHPPKSHMEFYRGGSVYVGSKVVRSFLLLAAGLILSLPAINNAIASFADRNVIMPILSSPEEALLQMIISGCVTGLAYHLNAIHLDTLGEKLWASKEGRAKFKTQPNRDMPPKLRREAVFWGNLNAFLTGLVGTGLLVVHWRFYPWAKYTVMPRGTLMFFRDSVISYVFIDLSAYLVHRLLHAKRFYWLHKWHHRFTVPTAHAAFAAHPIDYLVFVFIGNSVFCFFELNPIAFALVAIPTAYHNQIEHSGIVYSGEMPWTPTPQFHDDHHSQFTCNFGFEMVLWDWMFGTLRKKKGGYGEHEFHDTW
jgi:sterol desaturase/sphingolipid hydroxylase (fatty acid hydroxylase superfamily)